MEPLLLKLGVLVDARVHFTLYIYIYIYQLVQDVSGLDRPRDSKLPLRGVSRRVISVDGRSTESNLVYTYMRGLPYIGCPSACIKHSLCRRTRYIRDPLCMGAPYMKSSLCTGFS